ncbi:MAG: hypothetical protein JOY62_05465 [Acidobacteriaceae bacterium]|nr:hypothetical protein [Acidobacteriaceae bacterium]
MHLAIMPSGAPRPFPRQRRRSRRAYSAFRGENPERTAWEICTPDQEIGDPAYGMGIIVTDRSFTSASESETRRKIASEARLNLLAIEYGYKYRVDVCAGESLLWVEFVRTLQEARFVGRPLRRSGSRVRLFKIMPGGDLKRQKWG